MRERESDQRLSGDAASPPGTVLSFDFGTRKTGVAVGNTLLRAAHALTTIVAESNAARFAAIDALIAEWAPARLVVGRPLDPEGREHDMTRRAARFARQLEGRFGLPVSCVDERFTTKAAAAQLAGEGVRGKARKAAQDEVAAQMILQAWFDRTGET